jgi:hypothetical protein
MPMAASLCYDAGANQLVIPMNGNDALAFIKLNQPNTIASKAGSPLFRRAPFTRRRGRRSERYAGIGRRAATGERAKKGRP